MTYIKTIWRKRGTIFREERRNQNHKRYKTGRYKITEIFNLYLEKDIDKTKEICMWNVVMLCIFDVINSQLCVFLCSLVAHSF